MEPARRYVTWSSPTKNHEVPGGILVVGRKGERPDLPNSSVLKDAGAVSTKSLSGGRRKAENKKTESLQPLGANKSGILEGSAPLEKRGVLSLSLAIRLNLNPEGIQTA